MANPQAATNSNKKGVVCENILDVLLDDLELPPIPGFNDGGTKEDSVETTPEVDLMVNRAFTTITEPPVAKAPVVKSSVVKSPVVRAPVTQPPQDSGDSSVAPRFSYPPTSENNTTVTADHQPNGITAATPLLAPVTPGQHTPDGMPPDETVLSRDPVRNSRRRHAGGLILLNVCRHGDHLRSRSSNAHPQHYSDVPE